MVRAFSLNVVTHMCKKEEFHKGFRVPLLSRQPETQHGVHPQWRSKAAAHRAGELCAAAELYCLFQSLRVWSEDALH